jgi:hypothetical protein
MSDMDPTDAELELAYSPAVEALCVDFDIWYESGGNYDSRAAFWAAAEKVHGITDDQFDHILSVRLSNQLAMYRPWRSDVPTLNYLHKE